MSKHLSIRVHIVDDLKPFGSRVADVRRLLAVGLQRIAEYAQVGRWRVEPEMWLAMQSHHAQSQVQRQPHLPIVGIMPATPKK